MGGRARTPDAKFPVHRLFALRRFDAACVFHQNVDLYYANCTMTVLVIGQNFWKHDLIRHKVNL